MEEVASPDTSSICFDLIRRSDCSTDIEERRSFPSTQGRSSFRVNDSYSLFGGPITPKSDLFIKPNESPEYSQLNKCLVELYKKLESEMDCPVLEDSNEKTIQVKTTACSSLLQRRNNSHSLDRLNLKKFK
jgi:hypothetical protein